MQQNFLLSVHKNPFERVSQGMGGAGYSFIIKVRQCPHGGDRVGAVGRPGSCGSVCCPRFSPIRCPFPVRSALFAGGRFFFDEQPQASADSAGASRGCGPALLLTKSPSPVGLRSGQGQPLQERGDLKSVCIRRTSGRNGGCRGRRNRKKSSASVFSKTLLHHGVGDA